MKGRHCGVSLSKPKQQAKCFFLHYRSDWNCCAAVYNWKQNLLVFITKWSGSVWFHFFNEQENGMEDRVQYGMVVNAKRAASVGGTERLKCRQHQCHGCFLPTTAFPVKDLRMVTKRRKRPGLPTWHFCKLSIASSIELECRQYQSHGCILQRNWTSTFWWKIWEWWQRGRDQGVHSCLHSGGISLSYTYRCTHSGRKS